MVPTVELSCVSAQGQDNSPKGSYIFAQGMQPNPINRNRKERQEDSSHVVT